MERKWVIVCNRYPAAGNLLFWGYRTKDEEKRSFGGYTRNLDGCELYTYEELKKSGYGFPFYRNGMKWRTKDDFYIKVSDLEKLGRKMTVIYL